MGMVYAVTCFAAVGFEHCIANMFYVDLALMYGLKHTFGDFLGRNLILVTIGNIIGKRCRHACTWCYHNNHKG